jgi:hypothetical protein
MIVADTHCHLYACFDLSVSLTTLIANLDGLAPDATKAAFLVDPADGRRFRELGDGEPAVPGTDFTIARGADADALLVSRAGEPALYLFAGRQIVTAERIEILALTVDAAPRDGTPAWGVVESVLESGGVPVVAWAPGKWFFERGRVVRQLMEGFEGSRLLVGDTSLRARGWPEPGLMKAASIWGKAVLAGSDPLPLAGEERVMGTYGCTIDGPFDRATPTAGIRQLLQSPDTRITRVGRRSGPIDMIRRLWRHSR